MARRAADAVTNLAHENVEIKTRVRLEGGIPPLVALLDAWDVKVCCFLSWACKALCCSCGGWGECVCVCVCVCL